MRILLVSLLLACSIQAAVIEISTDQDFTDQVANVQGLVVVDFYATWCNPCKMMMPYFVELSNEFQNVKFVKVNVDSSSLKSRFGVQSIPQFLLFKNGVQIAKVVGASKKDLKKAIENYQSRSTEEESDD